ncbi:MAG: flagellar basal body rod C-terminal domain-containing protein, partial [Hyphomicrobiaceae bacterium]
LDFKTVGVRQGYLEKSNVNPVTEMMRLIEISRAFEAVTSSLSNSQSTMKESIRTLGESK